MKQAAQEEVISAEEVADAHSALADRLKVYQWQEGRILAGRMVRAALVAHVCDMTFEEALAGEQTDDLFWGNFAIALMQHMYDELRCTAASEGQEAYSRHFGDGCKGAVTRLR